MLTNRYAWCGERRTRRGNIEVLSLDRSHFFSFFLSRFVTFVQVQNTPTCQFSILGGSDPIALPFKRSQGMSPTRQVPISAQNPPRDKEILVKLTLGGECREATKEFCDVIKALPSTLKVTLVDAYQTDASALILVRMKLDVWARLCHGVDMEVVGFVIGPSLVHSAEPPMPKIMAENAPPLPHHPKPADWWILMEIVMLLLRSRLALSIESR
jgi:hypothetical protein